MEKLPIGEYTLHEEAAPEGYLVAEDVRFTVEDTGEIQKVVMKDKKEASPEKPNEEKPEKPVPDTPKTGDDRHPLSGCSCCCWQVRGQEVPFGI